MFKSRDVRFNENSVLYNNEKEFDIKITGLDTPINNNEDIVENIQNDENNENENDDHLNDDTNDDDRDNDNNDLNENILNENIEIDNNEVNVEENTEKTQQQQTLNDAWEGEVDTLHSKSDSDILPEKRVRKPTKRYVPGEAITKKKKSNQQKLANSVNIIDDEPETYEEAINSQFNSKWKEAIKSEVDALIENKTWTEMILPDGKKIINTRWVFKLKKDSHNVPVRFKARLVAKGYSQEKRINYTETFVPVIKHQSLRSLLAIVANESLLVHHIDISTAFLYGELDDEVYIEIPEGLDRRFQKGHVLKLNKALYGLKQAPRLWNKTLVNFLNKLKFQQLITDTCIFVNKDLIIAIYVDDIVIIGRKNQIIVDFKKQDKNRFKTKDLGNFILF